MGVGELSGVDFADDGFVPLAGFAAASCCVVAFCVAAALFAGGGVGGDTGVSSGSHLRYWRGAGDKGGGIGGNSSGPKRE